MPTSGAISQARARLGPEPLAGLFERVARPIAQPGTRGAWFHGWRVMAVDGVVLDVADTAGNLQEFGKSGSGRSESPFPQVRVVGLGECGTHAIIGAALDSWQVYERELLGRILYCLQPGMLVLADRGFFSYELWRDAAATDAELVWRINDNVEIAALEWLPDGSYRSELVPRTMKTQFKLGKLRHIPDEVRIPIRVVEYMVTNRGELTETIRLITSITDHEIAPAAELAALYQQRWEFELTLDEVETHQMPHSKVLRSKHPTSSARRFGRCYSPITPSAASCAKPPTTSVRTPTDYRSSAASGSSAARFSTRRAFPPHHLDKATHETIDEIQQRPNRTRRHRTCPRVVKRKGVGDKYIKRSHHTQYGTTIPPNSSSSRPQPN